MNYLKKSFEIIVNSYSYSINSSIANSYSIIVYQLIVNYAKNTLDFLKNVLDLRTNAFFFSFFCRFQFIKLRIWQLHACAVIFSHSTLIPNEFAERVSNTLNFLWEIQDSLFDFLNNVEHCCILPDVYFLWN